MLTSLSIHHFKSWKSTGDVRLAPITGLFGTNSSGKTSLLQFLLMLKQTVESADRSRVLHSGDDGTYVDLGTFYDMIHGHAEPGEISFRIAWRPQKPLRIPDPLRKTKDLFTIDQLSFTGTIAGSGNRLQVKEFAYAFDDQRFGMRLTNPDKEEYELIADGYELLRNPGRPWPLPAPVKSYAFPDVVNAYYKNAGFLSDLVLAFEELFQRVHYLGPLREYPSRFYQWAGEQPQDVGQRGDKAVAALLASREKSIVVRRGKGRKNRTVEEHVAWWLKELGLIDAFRVQSIGPNQRQYEVRMKRSYGAADALITDVGFGVSQVLPVLVLCFYAPEGSTIILEQPEIHLHPAVQAGLADVLIDAVQTRDVQIVLESHSEHLLRRLQRRIAEAEIGSEQVSLFFVDIAKGVSRLRPLALDDYGNITNWPQGFFGDEMGDLAAMTEAAMRRQMAKAG